MGLDLRYSVLIKDARVRHRFVSNLIIPPMNNKLFANKKPVPAFLPGQDTYFLRCHLAWRFHARSHVLTYADLHHVGSIRLTYSVSQSVKLLYAMAKHFSDISDIALRSPFDLSLSAALSPSAALWVTSDKAYSLFVIGLLFNFDMCILAHKKPFVNTFCKNIFNSVPL